MEGSHPPTSHQGPNAGYEKAYDSSSFFLLRGLPRGSEFGLNSQLWTVDRFSGVKFIPPGLHLFVFSAAPSASNNNNSSSSSSSRGVTEIREDDKLIEPSGHIGIGIRQGIFRLFRDRKPNDGKGKSREIVIEEWDNEKEELKSDGVTRRGSLRRDTTGKPGARTAKAHSATADATSSTGKKGGGGTTVKNVEEVTEETIVSSDYLKSLDSTLAPFPMDTYQKSWTPLVNFISESTIARVVGFDIRNNARVDSNMSSARDQLELKEAGGKRFWGKAREEEQLEPSHSRSQIAEIPSDVQKEEDDAQSSQSIEEDKDGVLKFVELDLKRSWPAGAVGEELSTWSIDKSWKLSNIVVDHFSGDAKELLAELQLSFVLFTMLHNFSSLEVYKSLFSLFCRSSRILNPPSSRRPISTTTSLLASESTLLTVQALPMYASFLTLVIGQIQFLDSDFFKQQMPGLDLFFLAELDALNLNFSEAASHWQKPTNPSDSGTTRQKSAKGKADEKKANHRQRSSGEIMVWNEVVQRWDELALLAVNKFGWELGVIKASTLVNRKGLQEYDLSTLPPTEKSQGTTPNLSSKWQDDDDEDDMKAEEDSLYVDIEDLEEGEDAPVIVEI